MRVIVLHLYTKLEVHRPCNLEDMADDVCHHYWGWYDLDFGPFKFNLETGLRVASKVRNRHSEFRLARPSSSPVIRYVRDGRSDGRTNRQKQRLMPPSLRARA